MKAEARRVALLGFVLLAFLAAGIGLAGAQEAEDKAAQNESSRKPEPAKVMGDPLRVTKHPFFIPPTEEYLIGPDDILAVNVWREPEISRSVPVRPDGRISLPLVGEVYATGLTPSKLEDKITEELKAYLSNPEVTVIVQEIRSHKFNIVGEVARPGSFHLAMPMTVLDALAAAGGFGDWAKTKKIYVLRRLPDGSRLTIPFNYNEVVKGKKFYQNVELKPGDTIVVP